MERFLYSGASYVDVEKRIGFAVDNRFAPGGDQCLKFLNEGILCPARLKHLDIREQCKTCGATCAKSLHQGVFLRAFGRQDVRSIKVCEVRGYPSQHEDDEQRPRGIRFSEHRRHWRYRDRAQIAFDRLFSLTLSSCPRGRASLRVPNNNELLPQLRECRLGCLHRVEDIISLGGRGQVFVHDGHARSRLCHAEASIVGRDDDVTLKSQVVGCELVLPEVDDVRGRAVR